MFKKNLSKYIMKRYLEFKKDSIELKNQKEKLMETVKLLYCSKQPDDWIYFLNIGNIMYLAPLNCDDLDLESDPRFELLRDAVIEKGNIFFKIR